MLLLFGCGQIEKKQNSSEKLEAAETNMSTWRGLLIQNHQNQLISCQSPTCDLHTLFLSVNDTLLLFLLILLLYMLPTAYLIVLQCFY